MSHCLVCLDIHKLHYYNEEIGNKIIHHFIFISNFFFYFTINTYLFGMFLYENILSNVATSLFISFPQVEYISIILKYDHEE